jgi:MYXO-CTERM domain-containing protein
MTGCTSRGRRRPSLVWLSLVVVLAAGGCDRDDPLAVAWRLAAREPTLARRLRPAVAFGVSLPVAADGPLVLGAPCGGRRLTMRAQGARPSSGRQEGAARVFEAAYPGTDIIVVPQATGAEILALLRDDQAPRAFSWQVELPTGFEVRAEGSGLALADASGHGLRVAPPFALDRRGVHRDAELHWETGVLTVRLDTRGLAYPILLDPVVEGFVWEQRTPAHSPGRRYCHGMAYDSGRQRTVLMGGFDLDVPAGEQATPLGDIWEWDGSDWTQVVPGSYPGRCPAMAYDSRRGRTVIVGGGSSEGPQGETLEWDGSTLYHLDTKLPALEAKMAYDVRHGVVVAVGDFLGSGEAVTAAWNGTSWTQVAGATPGAFAVVYDVSRERLILSTGNVPGSSATTWWWSGEPDGSTWAPLSDALAVISSAMVQDDFRRVIVASFACIAHPDCRAETWILDGDAWADLGDSGPKPRGDYAMAYDSVRRRAVLYGGDDSFQTYADTWELHFRGEPCATPADCEAPFCVDGACCDQSSCDVCQACNTAGSPGTCAPVIDADDPDTCTGVTTCNGAGICTLKPGHTCAEVPPATACACDGGAGECHDGGCACIPGDGGTGGTPPRGCDCAAGAAGGSPVWLVLLGVLSALRRRRPRVSVAS